jgi:small subunit ribosomal protein S16
MVRIRLRRVGGKKQASFRIVAADKESPRDGKFIEILGFYNPRTEPATIDLKEDRIYDWISKGAQPSESAVQIFQTIGLMDRYERFKGGEDVEKLVAEALEAKAARNVNPKTRYPAPVGTPKKTKPAEEAEPKAKVEKEAEEAPVEKEAVAEKEAPAEDEAVAEKEAPAEEAVKDEKPAEEASKEEEAPKAEEADTEEKKDAAEAPKEAKAKKPKAKSKKKDKKEEASDEPAAEESSDEAKS